MQESQKIVFETIEYIEKRLTQKLNLDHISSRVGYSKFHLNRVFSGVVGCTIHKYIQMRRLTVAAEKLVRTNEPIVEIGYEANYDSQQAFTLAFKQLYQYTPQAYRMRGIYAPKQEKIRYIYATKTQYRAKETLWRMVNVA